MNIESNEKLRRMIRELGRTLAEAISDSSKASRALRKLHDEGYAVSLTLGPSKQGGPQETLTLSLEKLDKPETRGPETRSPRSRGLAVPEESFPPDPPDLPAGTREPVFRIHSRDLAFLRSVGIDPTRRPPRRR